MKKTLIFVGIALGILVVAGISMLAWSALNITAPYLVKPLKSSPAPIGASVGHTFDSVSRTLSIVSSNDVAVVADPGASFKYEILWLVERPRKNGMNTLMQYRCDLPQFADANHVNPIGSQIPPKIQRVADGGQW